MTTCVHAKEFVFPNDQSVIFKEECVHCFGNILDEDGIYVCLKCFTGGCKRHILSHYEKFHHPLVFSLKKILIEKEKDDNDDKKEEPQHLTSLSINFEDDESKYETITQVFCIGCGFVPFSSDEIENLVAIILSSDSANQKEEKMLWEFRVVECDHSKNIVQPQNCSTLLEKSLSHCQQCDISDNLWLCLTCGNLGCGRKNFDGSGANNHAVNHYGATKHPLVCKMGTLTAEGNADVFCYNCDEMREDKELLKHLQTFGINFSSQVNTAKTMLQLELEQNEKFDWTATYNEDAEKEQNMNGPSYIGLDNIGNSCYFNSIIQIFFHLPFFIERYYQPGLTHINECHNLKPANCYLCQMAKLMIQFHSPSSTAISVAPKMLKSLISKNHQEFRSKAQQDSMEFFTYFLQQIQQNEHIFKIGYDPSSYFRFQFEQRLECTQCHCVKYSIVDATHISLDFPDVNISEEKNPFDISFPFNDIIKLWSQPSIINNCKCPKCQCPTQYTMSYRINQFPSILCVHIKRFVCPQWIPTKVHYNVDISFNIDIGEYFAKGKQANEVEFPQIQTNPEVNEEHLVQLISMGFPEAACIKSLVATKNSGVENAAEWLFSHPDGMDSSSIDTDPSLPEDSIDMIISMGFERKRAILALKQCDNNIERSIDWLFSHPDVMEVEEISKEANIPSSSSSFYNLLGIVQHLGKNSSSGHYITYLLQNQQWIKYNDHKVTLCEKPPLGQGYIYFFEQKK